MRRNPQTAQPRHRRLQAMAKTCPACGAEPGHLCFGKARELRLAPHIERYSAEVQTYVIAEPGDGESYRLPLSGSKPDQLIAEAASHHALRFVEEYLSLKTECESPIEELLMAALFAAADVSEHAIHFMLGGGFPSHPPYFDQAAFVYQQVRVGPYRVDMLIHDATLPFEIGEPRFMVVECDGHDFHERTKAQARHDKQRDRFLQSKGFKVLRFTGSEIWADPDKCADEIIDELRCNDDWRNREK